VKPRRGIRTGPPGEASNRRDVPPNDRKVTALSDLVAERGRPPASNREISL